MIGRTLGIYRIVEQIGMGGMATVYKAYDPSTDRHVAVKTIPPQFANDPSFKLRFEQEAKAIAKLEHIHILPVFAYGEEEGTAYMVMRYMDAGTLTDIIRGDTLPLDTVARFTRQIASALDYAHGHDVIHRDVKPSNVLVDRDGNAYLTDFGVAKMIGSDLGLTGTGNIVGTPQYMAPELFTGSEDAAPASDQYALGVMLYEMVTGKTPYFAETPWAVIAMIQREEPLILPRDLRPDLPEVAENVLLKGLSRDPANRFENCMALANAFTDALSSVPPPSLTDFLEKPVGGPATLPVDMQATKAGVVLPDLPTSEYTKEQPLSRDGIPMSWIIGIVVVGVIIGALVLMSGILDSDKPDTVVQVETPSDARSAAILTITAEASVTQAAETVAAVRTQIAGDDQTATAALWTATLTPTITNTPEPTATFAIDPDMLKHPSQDVYFLETCQYRNDLCEWKQSAFGTVSTEGTIAEGNINSAAYSPDGQYIVYSLQDEETDNNGGFYVVNRENLQSVFVPVPNINFISPAWSPDGEWIAGHANCGLAIIHPDGSELKGLDATFGNSCYQRPAWSPDSKTVAVFYSEPGIGNESSPSEVTSEVRLFDIETGDMQTLTTFANYQYCQGNIPDIVAFSPDGEFVVYVSADCNVTLHRLSDHTEEIISTSPNDFPGWWLPNFYPLWGGKSSVAPSDVTIVVPSPTPSPSPTPDRLKAPGEDIFVLESCSSGKGLCEIRYDAAGFSVLEGELLEDNVTSASYSPDGQYIVYSVNARGSTPNSGFYVMKRDGSESVEVSVTNTNMVAASWSPDGEWIAFHGSCNLVIIHPDGSGFRVLGQTDGIACYTAPAWSPDGKTVVALYSEPGIGSESSPSDIQSEVRLFDVETGDYTLLASIDHYQYCQDHIPDQVAFNPDGTLVAYTNADCNMVLHNIDDDTEEVVRTYDVGFPGWWLPFSYPQWGGISPIAPEVTLRILALDPLTLDDYLTPPERYTALEPCQDGQGLCIAMNDPETGEGSLTTLIPPESSPHIVGPAFSPDGEYVVYGIAADTDDGGLYIIRSDGSEQAFISTPGFSPINPSWSPDGEWIAYMAACNVAMIRPDGTDQRILGESDGTDCYNEPEWSPDSQFLVMNHTNVAYTAEDASLSELVADIRIVNIATGDVRILSVIQFDNLCAGEWLPIFGVFSPDGKMVAYSNGECELVVHNLDDDSQQVIANVMNVYPYWWFDNFYPRWAGMSSVAPEVSVKLEPTATPSPTPDYLNNPTGLQRLEPCDAGLCEVTDTDPTQHPVFEGPPAHGASYSPDGQYLVVTHNESGNALTIVRIEDQAITTIETNEGVTSPAWSPDGELIAFHGGCNVMVVQPDGNGLRYLTEMPETEICYMSPAWSPDSQTLAVLHSNVVPGTQSPPSGSYAVVELIDVASGNIQGIFEMQYEEYCHNNTIPAVIAFSPDGQMVAYVNQNCDVVLHSLTNLEQEVIGVYPYNFPEWWLPGTYPQWGGISPIAPTDIHITIPQFDELAAIREAYLIPPEVISVIDKCPDGKGFCISVQGELAEIVLPEEDITTTHMSEVGHPYVSFSPDGQYIAYSNFFNDTEQFGLFVAERGGSEPIMISPTNTTSVSPAWSPDGQWIAFRENGSLALIRPDGSEYRTLVPESPNTHYDFPTWSPDGSMIAVYYNEQWTDSGTPDAPEYRVVEVETGVVRTINTAEYSEDNHCNDTWYRIAFSPDGENVIYRNADCALVLHYLSDDSQIIIGGPQDDYPYWWIHTAYPQWGGMSPIAPTDISINIPQLGATALETYLTRPDVISTVDRCPDGRGMCIVNRDSGTQSFEVLLPEIDNSMIHTMAFSPDGQYIAYSQYRDYGTDADIFVVSRDGSQSLRLTSDDMSGVSPAWSPDGQWIVFHEHCAVALIRPDGSDFRVIVPQFDRACYDFPSWSPDGSMIAVYKRDLSDDDKQVAPEYRLVEVETGVVHTLNTAEYKDNCGTWFTVTFSPDGQNVLYRDPDCNLILHNITDGSQAVVGGPQDDYPYWWLNTAYPRWGGMSPIAPNDVSITIPQFGETASDVRYGMDLANQPYVGSADAEVVIVEFADYSCPYCQRFHNEIYNTLMASYEPHIRFVFRNFPVLGDMSVMAAQASECAYQQDRFMDYHNALFDADDEAFSESFFISLAASFEMDVERFTVCMEEQETLSAVMTDYEAGQAAQVNGTPTFLINGELMVGAQSFEAFADIIEAALGTIDATSSQTALVSAASPEWTGTGIFIEAGQTIEITAHGETNTHAADDEYANWNVWYPASGMAVDEACIAIEEGLNCRCMNESCPLTGEPLMTLIGRIGESESFLIGAGGVFTSDHSGELFLILNDDGFYDNAGELEVIVTPLE